MPRNRGGYKRSRDLFDAVIMEPMEKGSSDLWRIEKLSRKGPSQNEGKIIFDRSQSIHEHANEEGWVIRGRRCKAFIIGQDDEKYCDTRICDIRVMDKIKATHVGVVVYTNGTILWIHNAVRFKDYATAKHPCTFGIYKDILSEQVGARSVREGQFVTFEADYRYNKQHYPRAKHLRVIKDDALINQCAIHMLEQQDCHHCDFRYFCQRPSRHDAVGIVDVDCARIVKGEECPSKVKMLCGYAQKAKTKRLPNTAEATLILPKPQPKTVKVATAEATLILPKPQPNTVKDATAEATKILPKLQPNTVEATKVFPKPQANTVKDATAVAYPVSRPPGLLGPQSTTVISKKVEASQATKIVPNPQSLPNPQPNPIDCIGVDLSKSSPNLANVPIDRLGGVMDSTWSNMLWIRSELLKPSADSHSVWINHMRSALDQIGAYQTSIRHPGLGNLHQQMQLQCKCVDNALKELQFARSVSPNKINQTLLNMRIVQQNQICLTLISGFYALGSRLDGIHAPLIKNRHLWFVSSAYHRLFDSADMRRDADSFCLQCGHPVRAKDGCWTCMNDKPIG